MDERERALGAAYRAALGFFDDLDERPVWPRADLDEMLSAFGRSLPDGPSDAGAVIAELVDRAEPGLVSIPGGRFFGFVIGGTVPAALAADWLVSAWDQNSGSSTMTPTVVALERIAGAWVCELLGLAATASVGFVTGAQMANFACLAAARHAMLRRAGWDLVQRGLRGAPPLRFLAGADRHGAVDRALRFAGVGSDEITVVASDDQGRMLPEALSQELAAGAGAPAILCLQAGEVHSGAFDRFDQLIPLARRHGAWVHVDGAFGLWAAATPMLRHLTAGVGQADSWATDAHKTLNVPYDCGMAIMRDPADSVALFHAAGDYLIHTSLDPWDITPELSRRGRGVPAWAALRSLGRDGVVELVERLHRNARQLEARLRAIPGISVVNDVVYTQVMFRLDDDDATRQLGAAILADGTAALTGAQWRGRAVLRCSMSNWATSSADIDRTADAIARLSPTVASA
ncbi:aminotransferase class V-fold PLP-dependent enzyme [Microbacterium sp. zg.Y1090]|uniref:pyridoxal phosphate-dependent decarboxylase family protein n=1 Tax=Microbacterium TaxID=33882 RepID=UPI00214D00E6|nr:MULTISPECIES: aminotransferase class V-fold PLP-dependent enzyme [unclassified Microbacterium]MCR2811871.1 aminotransferase class V-fold PLP-dependent enzyme [Microbacterium sp. zg.Y1084]MCR2818690.1 aminotransferase class V-fold PLP-dependent enzyme [Microbacterium sp. zg.Y1090]MDL5486503.1 aminotransferase class V-fold PLP-dependent enzyme [Microbacterium sp. zg-Y1211]WIM27012.1 aminotransferase class V-fold PLP-dependent enzyme [Microbacterium sp. zg-Y1090]